MPVEFHIKCNDCSHYPVCALTIDMSKIQTAVNDVIKQHNGNRYIEPVLLDCKYYRCDEGYISTGTIKAENITAGYIDSQKKHPL